MKRCENCGRNKERTDFSWCVKCVEKLIDERLKHKNSIANFIASNLDCTYIGMYIT